MPMLNRSPESVERLFDAVRAAHRRAPSLRVGQLIVSAMMDVGWANPDIHQGLFHIENDELAQAIMKSASMTHGDDKRA